MIAILLCAGFATRMYPMTHDFPKPLLPVAGKPVLDFLCQHEDVYAFKPSAGRLDIGNIKTYREADSVLRKESICSKPR